jgi:hypothetical protein
MFKFRREGIETAVLRIKKRVGRKLVSQLMMR